MAHKALYRQWRPEKFEDLIGQDPIVTTLKSQIQSGQIAHAYLFTGTRGTGKTSTAKVFAKAVNCEKPEDNNPCNRCETCIGITEERIMDVMEIDAASNNGVENIREIRENVKYHPSKGKYKVYIIDEVHMLSQGAFNALLKTLEEPPGHVIFILATTEPRKIPATILSRCQRYDFKPVSMENIQKRLIYILESMEIEFEEEALRIISVSAEGALRDALSILEQSVYWEEKTLITKGVTDTLGIVPEEQLFDTIEALRKGDLEQALEILETGGKQGKDVSHFTKDLILYLRKLLMAKVGVELEQFSTMPKEFLQRLKAQSQKLSPNWITKNLEALSELEGKMKWMGQPRILLEVFMVQICSVEVPLGKEAPLEIKELAMRVQKLEGMIAGKLMAKAPERDQGEKVAQKISENHETTLNQQRPETEKKAKSINMAPEEKPRDQELPVSSGRKEKAAPAFDQEKAVPALDQEKAVPALDQEKAVPALDQEKIQQHWQDVLQALKKEKKAPLEALLKEAEILGSHKGELILGFEKGFGFHREALDKKEKKTQIVEVIHRITGETPGLKLIMKGEELPRESSGDLEKKLRESLPKRLIEFRDD